MLRNSKGLTLIEVLTAVAILSIVTLGFFAFSGNHAQSDQAIDQRNQAMQIAENLLNDTRNTIITNPSQPINNTSPPTNVPGYSAWVQIFPVNNVSTGSYSIPSQYQGKQHVSIQAIVYFNSQPQLLTVTVFWG